MHLFELECEFATCCAEAVCFSRSCAAVNDIDGTDALEVETDFFAAYASLWCFFSVVSFCLLMFCSCNCFSSRHPFLVSSSVFLVLGAFN